MTLSEPATLPESMSRDEMLRYYSEYANMVAHEVVGYQKQIRDLKAALATSTAPPDDEGDSYDDIWNALQRIDTAASMLPTYAVRHEGGIKAFTQNVIDAIVLLDDRSVDAGPSEPVALKDHQIAQTVNALVETCRTYGHTQQLRERIAGIVVPLLKTATLAESNK